jgi:hypothetical protein
VLGEQTRVTRDVHGSGAIRTRAGLAWFTVRLSQSGAATVKVFDPMLRQHFLFTGATVSFGTNSVRITTGTMTLTLSRLGSSERVSFHSLRFRASGKVVRGGYIIV